MKPRLAVVVSHPIQHFAPWHREVARRGEVDLRVFYCCDWGVEERPDVDFGRSVKWDVPLLEGYEHEFLPLRRPIERLSFLDVDNPTVGGALERFAPQVILLFGYMFRTYWRVAWWAKRHRVPVLLYSDADHGRRRAAHVQLVKEVVVRGYYRLMDGAFVVGDNNGAYHRYYGIPEERLFPGMLPIDRDRLVRTVPDRGVARAEIRDHHGIPADAFVAVWCGKFIPRKRARDLLEAARLATERGSPVHALMVGEGPERPRLEAFVREARLDNVTFAGFVNQSRVPAYLAASDVLAVTSSDDPHPLVVTEAASFGLPCVVSDAIGCVGPTDTARPGENARVYPCGDAMALYRGLEDLRLDPARYEEMSGAALQISMGQDASVAAERLVEAAERLIALGKR